MSLTGSRATRSFREAQTSGGIRPVRLLVLDGPDRGREALVDRGTGTIGSGEGCELQLTDDTVSRRHATVELLGRRVRVSDVGSKNGTLYLGARIDGAQVPIGSTIQVGRNQIGILPLAQKPSVLSQRSELQGLVGVSVPMRRLFAALEHLAPTDVPLLLYGESGTGKELAARAVHQLSDRAAGPFRVFDCSAVHPNLVHSALFGHAAGAYTGAPGERPGAIEEADGGTLFLDELGELPLDVQPLLLRVLETHQFSRVGEGAVRRADFRLVCATHRSLEQEVERGRFRRDLYYRLPAAVVELPALRSRPEDIPLLAEHFARAKDAGFRFDPAELAVLNAHLWPGNVRELRNSVERLVALRGAELAPAGATALPVDFHATRERVVQTFERVYLESLLAKHHGVAAPAARESGLGKSYFYKLLALHGLTPNRRRKG